MKKLIKIAVLFVLFTLASCRSSSCGCANQAPEYIKYLLEQVL